jgi:small subunit ribosomal protein S20
VYEWVCKYRLFFVNPLAKKTQYVCNFALFRELGNHFQLILFLRRINLPLPSETFENYTMANHKATKKDVRQSKKRNERNRYHGKTTRNAIRDLKAITDKAAAGKELPEVLSMIDKLAKRNVIHKNKAANLKSKLTKSVNVLA